MTTTEGVYAVSIIVALGLLPVGVIRMLAYRSGNIDHTPKMRLVARMALGLGGLAALLFVVLTVWFLARGDRPF